MPTRLIYEGSEDCESIRVIHSNPLQENATYRADRRVSVSGESLRVYLDKTGDGIQPGDPVILRTFISGDGYVQVTEEAYDNYQTGFPGKAEFIPSPASIADDVHLVWPVEIEIKANPDLGYFAPGFTLRSRSQRSSYRPGMTDELIREDPMFASLYDAWLTKRAGDWYWYNDYYPEPPEDYEREAAENNILVELRDYFSVQWEDWADRYSASEETREGSYWTGSRENGDGAPIFHDYRIVWQVQMNPILYHSDGETSINPGGSDTYTLLVKEFGDEGGDRNNEYDWTEMLRVNFSGTPEPVTIECDDLNCPNHCLELRREPDKAWACICHEDDLPGTPISPNPNRIERKPSPDSPDPRPPTLGDRKAKARDYQRKLQPQFDKAKAKYQEQGNIGEAAHNLHRAQDAIAKDPTKTQPERDSAAAAAAQALLDRDDATREANNAAADMLDARRGLDALRDFLKDDPDDDSGISVGAAPPKPTSGWRPPLVMGGTGWNSTPTYINNDAEKQTTQTFGPSGGIQAPQIVGGGGFQSPQSVGGGIQPPQIVGGGNFVPGQWNATPTVIIETPGEIVNQIITSEE